MVGVYFLCLTDVCLHTCVTLPEFEIRVTWHLSKSALVTEAVLISEFFNCLFQLESMLSGTPFSTYSLL